MNGNVFVIRLSYLQYERVFFGELLNKKVKTILSVVLIIGVCALFYLVLRSMLPDFFTVLEHGDNEEVQEYIKSSGNVKGVILTALLQFVQVVSIVFPGLPIQVAAGVIFGTFFGFVICHLSYVGANVCVFLVARRLGNRITKYFYTNEKTGKKNFGKMIADSEYPGFMVILGCLIPLLPNGIVPYMAARSNITIKRFAVCVYIGSFPTILVLCSVGKNILAGDFNQVIWLSALLVLFIAVLYKYRDKIIKYGGKIYQNITLKHDQKKNNTNIPKKDTSKPSVKKVITDKNHSSHDMTAE